MQNFDNAHINEEKSKLDKMDNKLDDLESRLSRLGSVLKIPIYLIMVMVFYICVKLSLDNTNVGQSLESENISIRENNDGNLCLERKREFSVTLSKEQVEKFGGFEKVKAFIIENRRKLSEGGKVTISNDVIEILGIDNVRKILAKPAQWKTNKSN